MKTRANQRILSVLLALVMVLALSCALLLITAAEGDTAGTVVEVSPEDDLSEAIKNVSDNGTVRLTGDISLTAVLEISVDKKFTLDLGTYNITQTAEGNAIDILSGAVTITGTGTITGTWGGVVVKKEGAKLTTEGNVTFKGPRIGGIYIQNGDAVINGGTVQYLYVSRGNVTVNGGSIEANDNGKKANVGTGTLTVANGVDLSAKQITNAYIKIDRGSAVTYLWSLSKAVEAAGEGDVITLLCDIESDRINLEDKSVTVNLNGYTLTSTADYGVMFCAKNGHKITIDGTVADSKLVGTLMITAGTDGHIEINGGTYENSQYCPIYVNGAVNSENSTVTVKDAVITATGTDSDQDAGVAVYLAGYATSVFDNVTVTAPVTGIEIRAGKLTLNNCTVTGGNGEVETKADGNGNTVANAALAVSQHNTKKPIEVTVNGGTFTATAALYQTDVQGTGSADVKANVTAGTFNGTVAAETTGTVAVSGGTFSATLDEALCADGFIPTANADGTYTVEECKPFEVWTGFSGTKVGAYATIEEAAANLGENKWIVVAKDVTLTADFAIPEGVFLDVADGATLTVADGVTLTVAANAKRLGVRAGATLINNGTIKVCGTDYNNGKVMVLTGGTFDVSTLTPLDENHVIDNNGSNYFSAEPVFEATYADGTTKKAGQSGVSSVLNGAVKLTLLKDLNGFAFTFGSTNGLGENFVFDLGGYTITGTTTAKDNVFRISVPMTIKNGTIRYASSDVGYGALYVSADVTIAGNATIDGGVGYAICAGGYGHTLTVNGTLLSYGAYAVTGNGSENGGTIDECNIIVNDGAVIEAPNGIGIYHPMLGTVTVNGGVVTAHTGIQICAGSLVINDGTITSTGVNFDADGSQNAIKDGAAVSIINRNYPGGTPALTIRGGTIKAVGENALAVKAYDYTENKVADWADAGLYVNISGGTFSSAVDEALCADGFTMAENDDGTYSPVPTGYVEDEDGNVTISDEEGLFWFAMMVNQKGVTYAGKTVTLAADIVLTRAWTPVGISTAQCFRGTFDGAGHTISGMKVTDWSVGYGAGFFEVLVSGTVRNVTFADAVVKAPNTNAVGIVSGYAYGSPVFENVHVTGSSVHGFGKVGGFVGMNDESAGITTFRGCSIVGTTVRGTYNMAGFCGLVMGKCNISGSLSDVTVVFDDESNVKKLSAVVTCDGSAATCAGKGTTISGYYWFGSGYYWSAWSELYNHYGASSHDCAATVDGKSVLIANSEMTHDAVAKIEKDGKTVLYSDLQTAFDAAVKGDTVTLLCDVTLTEQVNILNALDGLTLDGNGHTILCATTTDPTQSGGSALYFGNASLKKYCTGITIRNLTMTGTARFAIFLCGGTSTTFENVHISGRYYIAVNLYGTHGATMTDCSVENDLVGADMYNSAIWSNVAAANPLKLVNTTVSSIAINAYTTANTLAPKIFVDATSSVGEIHTFDDGSVSGDKRLCVSATSEGTYALKEYAEGEGWVDLRVAKITDAEGGVTYFGTLSEAFAAAKAGDTITLVSNLTTDAAKTAAADRLLSTVDVTLDLAGHTLTIPAELEPTSNWAAIFVMGGTLTVRDSVGGGRMQSGTADVDGVYLFNVNGGHLIIESGDFFAGITVAQAQKGTVTVLGGHFAASAYNGRYDYMFNCVDAAYKDGSAGITIEGGTFEHYDPRHNGAEGSGTDFVAPGVGVDTDENGNFTAVSGRAAQIVDADGSTVASFATLAEAFAAAAEGQTVKLLDNVTVAGEQVVIGASSDFILDLAGKTLKVSKYTANKVQVDILGAVILTDSVGGGVICSDYTGTSGIVVCVENGGSLTINGGTITTEGMTNAGNALKIVSGAAVTMNGGTVKADGKRANRAVNLTGATSSFVMTGGEVIAEADAANPGETYIIGINGAYNSVIAISGGTVSGPEAVSANNSAITITGGSFSGTVTVKVGAVSGGTFDRALAEKACAAGFIPEAKADGTYGVKEGVYVVRVNGVGYESLEEAFAAAKDGDTVKLLADATADITLDKSITLDLGGFTLTGTGASGTATLTVAKGVTATVKNGTILGTANSYYTIQNNGTLTLADISAVAGNTGSSMLDNWGTLTIESGTYTGGLNVVKSEEGSVLVISGGTFTLEYAVKWNYNAVILVYGDTTITGGTFIQNAKTTSSYPQVIMTGVVDGYTSHTTVTGGTFTNNFSSSSAKIFHNLGKATYDNFEVSGGTYNKLPAEGYFADGYIPTKNSDGTYGAKVGRFVAHVSSTGYETLAAAVKAATKGKTVKLEADVTEDIVITKSITLDLGGFTLTGTGASGTATLTVNAGAVVTVKNGTILGTANSYYTIQNNGTLTLADISAVAGNTGSSMLANFGTLTITSGTYTGGMNTVINKPGATLTVNGGTFSTDYAENNAHTGVLYNLGNLTVNDGIFTHTATSAPAWAYPHVIMTAYEDTTPSTVILGGTFTSTLKTWKATVINHDGAGSAGSTKVSGGTFNMKVSEGYCADGFIPEANADGTYGVKEGVYVVRIDGVGYESLEEAFAAAKDGDTLTLVGDVSSGRINLEDKSVKVVLNGHTLTSTASYGVMFCVKNGHKITIDGTVAGSKLVGTLMITAGTDGHIEINGGTYENSQYCPIYVNGAVSSENSTVTVKDAVITGADLGVYLAGYATSVFENVTVTAGTTGIEIRAGKLTLSDCIVSGGNGEVEAKADGNGNTVANAALAISQHNTKKPIEVTINGGTFTATAALYQTDVQGTGSANVKAAVKDGTFNGTVAAETAKAVSVSGGTFSAALDEALCADGFIPKANADGTYGVKEGVYVVRIDGVGYESLEEAFAAAKSGDTLTLAADAGITSTIRVEDGKDLTLALNGHDVTITTTGKYILVRGATLTITGNGTVREQNPYFAPVILKGGPEGSADYTVVNIGAGVTLEGWAGVMVDQTSGTANNYGMVLNIEGATLRGVNDIDGSNGSALYVNGVVAGAKISLTDVTMTGTGTGMYLAGYAETTVTGGSVKGDVTGIEIRAGKLTLNDCDVTGGSGELKATANGSGATVENAALAISQHTTKKPIEVTINGGTFTATAALYQTDVQGTGSADVKASVTAGTFNGTVAAETAKAVSVSGGTFSAALDEAICADGFIPTANDDGTYGVAHAVTVIVASDPANSGILSGGGKYAEGSKVTLVAKAVTDYTFLGWYDADGVLVSEDLAYTFTATADASFTARFKSDAKRKLTVSVGHGEVEYTYVNADEQRTDIWENDITDTLYAKGTRFTVTAKAMNGYTFLYWINADGRVLSEEATYEFLLGDSVKLTACYRKTEGTKPYVIFRDLNDKILEATDAIDGYVTVPAHNTFAGYTFLGWFDENGNELVVTDGKIAVTGNMVITARYKANDGLTVTVNGTAAAETYSYGDKVTVTADAMQNGKYFSGWYIGDMIVSDRLEYVFYVTGNTVLEARYEGSEPLTRRPIAALTVSDRQAGENGRQTIQFSVSWTMPEGFTVAEAGLLLTASDEKSGSLTLPVSEADKNTVFKYTSLLTGETGTYAYTLTLKGSMTGRNVYAVGYVVYQDAAGNTLTLYTPVFTSAAQ